jgi:hypothetical protein
MSPSGQWYTNLEKPWDHRYTLEGMIEIDEGYFTVESTEIEKQKGIRGRGAAGKSNVAILAESTPLEENGKTQGHCRYFKAKVLDDHTAQGMNLTIGKSLSEKSIVFTDKSTSYVDIADFVELAHNRKKQQGNNRGYIEMGSFTHK